MTAQGTSSRELSAADFADEARAHLVSAALAPSTVGQVGLELEFHLVDLRSPARRLAWDELGELIGSVPPLPEGSTVTIEPGGQLELSTPPRAGVAAAISALQRDRRVLVDAVAQHGLGLAAIGSDLGRPVRRLSPVARYVAMERHFDAMGCGASGRAMMSATAALQVNLNAGPRERWGARFAHIHRLGPVLVALSACSPLLAGRASGWRSMRQQAWTGIDQARCRPLAGSAHPADAWADYALAAPVMLVRNPNNGGVEPVTQRVRFAEWAAGGVAFGRPPGLDDLDYHLSTLFPPVRPRGYLEIRCLDAVPNRWWPALAALTVTLIDDEVAADEAAELCEPTAGAWLRAARDGLTDPSLLKAAWGCADIAASRCPPELRPEVEAYAELVARGRTPGDHLRERANASSPLAVMEEEAHA
jgi:glutamate--cysteine ligase